MVLVSVFDMVMLRLELSHATQIGDNNPTDDDFTFAFVACGLSPMRQRYLRVLLARWESLVRSVGHNSMYEDMHRTTICNIQYLVAVHLIVHRPRCGCGISIINYTGDWYVRRPCMFPLVQLCLTTPFLACKSYPTPYSNYNSFNALQGRELTGQLRSQSISYTTNTQPRYL